MFESAIKDNLKAACVLLTGMGKDGAAGLFQVKQKGAMTFAQDEASCIVFGMPGVAINMGAAGFIGNIPEIRNQLDSCIGMS
jgi:two-component system chemotaxis response regulator CheB